MNTTKPKIAVALLDDHPIVTFGLALRLQDEPDIEIAGRYASANDLIAAFNAHTARIDVLVTDYQLRPGDIDGISLIRLLKIKMPAVKIVVSSAFHTLSTVTLAMNAGARGFVGKEEPLDRLVTVVREVARGAHRVDSLLDAERGAYRAASAATATKNEVARAAPANLTLREREVLRCFATGMSVSDIAAKFRRSLKTISTQKQSAYRKLGIRTDFELYAIVDELG
ncbi:response regulator transcription factor [Burkholderia multivorans]|uniref:response regulator transcription factor n=1 Tax=Burkholderia multivorans TaxID=87883 RepID=UPI001B94632E|nr:response regulator transcription factor [Burkholderia multivorans]MBR8123120.1 response regulator transcription factor [Burkholderia multivorans]MBU9600442.1 response regulator transcription factor [Burkholderia multivorans]